jgi:glyoxylase-like metal-dependent hydrolase (beta-lactamase superfamily II)
MKRVLIWASGIFIALLIGVSTYVYTLFGGLKPIDAGADLGHAVVVPDESNFVSSYIVDAGDGSYFLIDAGVDGEGTQIIERLEQMGAERADVTHIFLTHAHSDHIAGWDAFPNATVWVHEADAPLATGKKKAGGFLTQFAEPASVDVDETFSDGQVIEVGERTLTVHHTPGHTAGHVSFVLDGVLFLGDAAGVGEDDRLVETPWIFSTDPEQAVDSVRNLSDRVRREDVPLDTIVGSHTGPTDRVESLHEFGR